eukprot:jgi/Chrzof1/8208/Cz03g01170.t1
MSGRSQGTSGHAVGGRPPGDITGETLYPVYGSPGTRVGENKSGDAKGDDEFIRNIAGETGTAGSNKGPLASFGTEADDDPRK